MAAANLLKRPAALVWLPPRSVGERALVTDPVLLVAPAASPDRPLQRMSLDAMPPSRAVALLFDARDVTLLEIDVPALPPGRLVQALPNIVEDWVLQDPGACAFALGPEVGEGRRLVAVIDRSWLECVLGVFERRGASIVGAWPAQLALPLGSDGWTVACTHASVAIRTGPHRGFGWAGGDDAESVAAALTAALQALGAEASPQHVDVFVEQEAWIPAVARAVDAAGCTVRAGPLAVPFEPPPIDLLQARQGSAGGRLLAGIDWRAWRWPAALAMACAVLALVGLNLHWMQLARERAQLNAQLERSFRQTFPQAQVVIDPVLQMQRQLATLRARSGQSGPEDFVPLAARFAAALGPRGADALAAMDFRDGRLKVRFQSGLVDAQADREALREQCARHGLRLQFDGDAQPTATVSIAS